MEFDTASLSRADQLHLSAASGWIGLGDFDSARAELDELSAAAKKHPQALLVQSEYFFATEEWSLLVPLTDKLVQKFPEEDCLWINRSYALHELKRTQEAFDVLLPATEKFPKVWLIRYNLACYCAQLGNKEESLRWLLRAIKLADKNEVLAMALDDPDLVTLRDALREL